MGQCRLTPTIGRCLMHQGRDCQKIVDSALAFAATPKQQCDHDFGNRLRYAEHGAGPFAANLP
jgi:hypothetical protein